MFRVMVWETKFDRDEGFAFISGEFTDLEKAINQAEYDFAVCESVEILDDNNNVIRGYYPEDL